MAEKKTRFNWFDVLCIVIFVLAVVATVWALNWRDSGREAVTETPVTLRCVVKVEGLRDGLEDGLARGDAGYLVADSGMVYPFGTVVGIQTENSSFVSSTVTKTMTDENGQPYEALVRSDLSGRNDVSVTFEVGATLAEDGRYYVDGCLVAVGTYMKLMTPHLWCEGYCISVSEAN